MMRIDYSDQDNSLAKKATTTTFPFRRVLRSLLFIGFGVLLGFVISERTKTAEAPVQKVQRVAKTTPTIQQQPTVQMSEQIDNLAG